MKLIIGIVGPIAAGKTTVADYLKQTHGAVTFRFSTMLRDVADRLYLEKNRQNLQVLSTTLRNSFGDDLMSNVIAKDVAHADADMIVVEGIRRPSDVHFLKKLDHFYTIAINADEQTRYDRITSRQENPDDTKKTWGQFQKDGGQESEEKISEIAIQADFQLDNNGTREHTMTTLETILKAIRKKDAS
jgi:dephospho-CoA kinase